MEFLTDTGCLPPGFRFTPTDIELFMHYLKRKVLGKPLVPEVVAEVDIYQFHPEDLRELAYLKKDLIWYFFCPREKKYANGDKTKRATQCGFWKVTGKGKCKKYQERIVGKVKTLVFHLGKPSNNKRTDWVMHEYRLDDIELASKGVSQDAFVLCKIFKKSGRGPKTGEQYGAPYIEEEYDELMVPVADDDQDQITSVDHSFPAYIEEEHNAPMVPVADQDQFSINHHTFSVADQGLVPVSMTDQASALLSYGSDVASTSKDPDENDDYYNDSDDDLDRLLRNFAPEDLLPPPFGPQS